MYYYLKPSKIHLNHGEIQEICELLIIIAPTYVLAVDLGANDGVVVEHSDLAQSVRRCTNLDPPCLGKQISELPIL